LNILGFLLHLHETTGARVLLKVLVLLVMVESVALAGFSLVDHRFFSFERIRADRHVLAGSDDEGSGADVAARREKSRERLTDEILRHFKGQTLHPFLGFVFDPALTDDQMSEAMGGLNMSKYGFLAGDVVFEPPRSDRVVVGVTGGSVGMLFSLIGRETLEAELRKAPELAGKKIELVTLALPGYKQPQQLFSLNYFLVLGAHFDWIINLDGFNEIALSVVENVPKKVSPFFPRAWYWSVHEAPDRNVRRWMGQVTCREAERRDLARSFSKGLFDLSVTWNLVWRLLDRDLEREIATAQHELLTYRPDKHSFASRGPLTEHEDVKGVYEELTSVWSESSLQMHRLCESNGIRYFHFLQPNQYLPESKPMGSAEKARAWSAKSPFVEPIARGYPMLQAAGEELRAQGVRFHDVTGIFAGGEEWIYTDRCCHYNEEGNRLLASMIAQVVLDDLRAE